MTTPRIEPERSVCESRNAPGCASSGEGRGSYPVLPRLACNDRVAHLCYSRHPLASASFAVAVAADDAHVGADVAPAVIDCLNVVHLW